MLNRQLFHILIIIVISGGVYLNALRNGFVYDDNIFVETNPYILEWRNIPKIFATPLWSFEENIQASIPSNYYRPMLTLTFLITYKIFGLNPWGFHLASIILHVFSALLVYFISLKLLQGKKLALIAALLFGAHPIHTESVTWVSGVNDVGCAVFLFLSFYLYRTIGIRFRLPLSVLSFLTALLYKETAVIFPLLLISYEYLLCKGNNRFNARAILILSPYVLILAAYLLLRFYVLGGFAPLSNPDAHLTNYQVVLSSLYLLLQYIWKLLLPVNLNAFHTFTPILSMQDIRFLISVAAFSLIVILWIILGKRDRLTAFTFLWVILPLLPALYLIKTFGGEFWNIFCERYLYIPSFGFVIFISYIGGLVYEKFSKSPFWRAGITGALLMILLLYSLQTVLRNMVWRDNFTLYTDGLRKSPQVALLHNNLGFWHLLKGEVDKAESKFMDALKADPRYEKAYYNLGLVYMRGNEWAKARIFLEKSLSIKPFYADTYANLGIVYLQTGEIDRAEDFFKKALGINPDYLLARKNLGIAYEIKGKYDEAIMEFQGLLERAPDDHVVYYYLCLAYAKNGEHNPAIKACERALEIKPGFKEVMELLNQLNNTDEHFNKK